MRQIVFSLPFNFPTRLLACLLLLLPLASPRVPDASASVGYSFAGASVGYSFAGASVGYSFAGASVGYSFAPSSFLTFTTRDGLAGNLITALAFASDGAAWIGTTTGATRIENARWTTFTRAHGLGDDWVTALAVAPDGRVWFGTYGGGASVFDGKKFSTFNLSNSSIPSNFVTALAVDSKGIVWFGTLAAGVAQFNPATNRWTQYASANNQSAALAADKVEHPGGTELIEQTARALGLDAAEITTSAQDARGRVWVGTPRGLRVAAPSRAEFPQPPLPLPVVLVHGWTGPASDELQDSEFRFLQQYAERDGFRLFFAQGISPKNTLFENAAHLRDEIARVKKETGADRVNIIAFSMGGLNTRAYLESALYQNDVNRAIILGTPQAGVDIWKPILFQKILQKPDEPSAIELSPEYARLFNTTHAPRASVPYDLLIGDARTQTQLDFIADLPASDGLISVDSALALYGANVRQHVNADLHAFEPTATPFRLTSYLYPRDTYDRYLRNALRDAANAPLGSEIQTPPLPLPPSQAGSAVDPVGAAGVNHTPVVTQPLRAGETQTRTLWVDANSAARFIAYFPEGEVDFTLTAPNGKLYRPVRNDSPVGAASGAAHLQADIANFSGYAIKNAAVGAWRLTLTRTDRGTRPLDVTTYADLRGLRRVGVVVRANVNLGAAVTISATLDARASDVKMSARIAEPARVKGAAFTFADLALYDDGAHDDGAANDGVYANTYTPTRAGYHLVFVNASAPNFARETESLFAVKPEGNNP